MQQPEYLFDDVAPDFKLHRQTRILVGDVDFGADHEIDPVAAKQQVDQTEATLGFLSIPSFSIRYASVKVKMPSVTKSTPSMVEAIGIAVSKLVLSISHFRHSSRSIMLAVVPPQMATLPS